MGAFAALVGRDLKLALASGSGAFLGVVFFLILAVVLPLGVGPDLNLLARLGPAFLWIGALLSTLLALDRLFQSDAEDGSLDLLALGHLPLEAIVLAKSAAHWLASVLPLVAAAPLLGLFFNMDPVAIGAAAATLLAGTPALTLIGAIGAALTVSLRRGGMLIAILVLPLALPVLIFGVSATNAVVVGGLPFRTPFLILCALSLGALALAPFAAAAALRAGRG
jgi:heme exporter protein B